jgi:hypothetical protein
MVRQGPNYGGGYDMTQTQDRIDAPMVYGHPKTQERREKNDPM